MVTSNTYCICGTMLFLDQTLFLEGYNINSSKAVTCCQNRFSEKSFSVKFCCEHYWDISQGKMFVVVCLYSMKFNFGTICYKSHILYFRFSISRALDCCWWHCTPLTWHSSKRKSHMALCIGGGGGGDAVIWVSRPLS